MKVRAFAIGAAAAAAVTVAFGAAVGPATGATGAAAAPSAVDPVTGTFVLGVGFDRAPRTHTVVAAADGLKITAGASYRTAGTPVPGTSFWAIDRTGIDQANTASGNCTVAAGTVVVGQLTYTSTDASGTRHYTGAGLKGVTAPDSPYACSFAGLQRPLYMTLGRHGDTSDKDGPYNILCWNDDSPTANSCSSAFIRLAGTWTPGAVTTTGTATTPTKPIRSTPARPLRGLVPRSSKWYLDKRFKSDHVAPVIKAIASTGRRGQPFFLAYTSKDDRGFAGEIYAIFGGNKLLKMWSVMAGERDGRVQRAPARLPASVSGKLTFCVGGSDLNGNRSAWSCAPLTIS